MLPPYSYVPGKFPHPIADPAGHSHDQHPAPTSPLNPDRWQKCAAYLRGIELFNHGYYWEAHESWESAWIAAGREGIAADFLKGLIKLAAAGVKAREGRPEGVRRHARRGRQLLETVLRRAASGPLYCGLDVPSLIDHARQLDDEPEAILDNSDAPVVKVMPFQL